MTAAGQRKKILLLVRLLGQGGSERQTAVTALELRKNGYETHIGCVDPNGIRAQELRAAGVPVFSLPIRTLAAVETIRQGLVLRDYIRRERIDLVHSFDVPMNIFGVPFAALARRAVVLSSQRAHRELTPGLHHRLLRISDRMVDGIVVNCDFMRRHLIEDEGVRAERIRLCYNGIDLAQFHPGERERAPEFGGAPLVIGVVCGLRKEKGLSTLVEAFASVRMERSGVKLAIIGSGVCLEELQQQAAALGAGKDTLFLPETRDVPRLLRGIDIFVLPSLSEALSNSLMEAMAAGCCAVASRVGGNPELIHHGETGLLFEKADAAELAAGLRRVLRDDAFRLRLATAGAARMAADFTVEASAQTMAAIYEEFLAASK
ncbi:MAG: glycosyltransferase family 4 protein [Bryobacterales bacterium]|nr:glycosyltransferase family 4 protein [Bryobacterales bacterium]